MKKEITFVACKYLDFSDTYSAKKEIIRTKDGNKICWNRNAAMGLDYSFLVQYCKKFGILHSPFLCLCKLDKDCSDYKAYHHTVTFDLLIVP